MYRCCADTDVPRNDVAVYSICKGMLLQ